MSIGIHKILKSGESETVEFKQSLAEKDQILETVSSFSNTQGGKIYVGIDDSGRVPGVQIGKRTLEALANDIKLATDPKIFPSISTISTKGKEIILIEVQEHPVKPVWVGEKVYERVSKTNQRVPAERIRLLIRESQPFQWDQQIFKKAALSDIHSGYVKDFLRKVEEERNTKFSGSRSVKMALEKLRLQSNGKPTAASILLFGKDPQKWFVQSEIRCARFKGTEAVDFNDMTVVRGTLVHQVPEVLRFIRKHVQVAAKISGRLEREDVWDYPKEALREAIVNAICHRDYQDTGNVQVRIFDNRIEIWNPGTLPAGLTVEDLKGEHRSQPHNALLAECFYLVKYVEQWGTGTNRMLRICKEAGLPEPLFEQRSDSFIVTLQKGKPRPQKKDVVFLGITQKRILAYIKSKKGASTSEIAGHLRLSERSIQKNLQGMMHLLAWTGKSANDPHGKYFLRSSSETHS